MDISRLDYVLESVIDPPQGELSPEVWKDGVLRPQVRSAILQAASRLSHICTVSRVVIIGGIATYNWSDSSDIDVNVEFAGASERQMDVVRKTITQLNGQVEFGGHLVNYWGTKEIDPTRYDSIYDVVADRWLDGPKRIDLDITQYLDQFEEKVRQIDLLRFDINHQLMQIDVAKLPKNRELLRMVVRSRLAKIDAEVSKLIGIYDDLIDDRREAFANPDIRLLRRYKLRSALPDNVIYLLLRKFYYLSFLADVEKIDKPRTMQDLNQLKAAVRQL